MKHLFLLLVSALLLSANVLAQLNPEVDTMINLTDFNGLKQGKWEKKYPNGKLAYSVYFVDGKPIGEYKRFHTNGKLNAFLIYDEKGEYATATLYDESENIIAEGFYKGQEKDSTWTYYTGSKKKLVSTERWENGGKNGMEKLYFENGAVAEEKMWVNGLQNGIWRRYYSTGKKKYETVFKDGEMNGRCYYYYSNGRVDIKGFYKDDKKDSTWTYYDGSSGNIKYTIEYKNGVAVNQAELDSLERVEFEKMERESLDLIDPQDYMRDPYEYIEKSRQK